MSKKEKKEKRKKITEVVYSSKWTNSESDVRQAILNVREMLKNKTGMLTEQELAWQEQNKQHLLNLLRLDPEYKDVQDF